MEMSDSDRIFTICKLLNCVETSESSIINCLCVISLQYKETEIQRSLKAWTRQRWSDQRYVALQENRGVGDLELRYLNIVFGWERELSSIDLLRLIPVRDVNLEVDLSRINNLYISFRIECFQGKLNAWRLAMLSCTKDCL